MKFLALSALAGAAAASPFSFLKKLAETNDTSDHWAVIMAGSNTYSNYRHQADSHHAVQIMLENGIARDHIIHLAYDDVANNRYNPFPGELYNVPSSGPGVNVYDADNVDYTGADVTKENFFKVLTGDSSASGPVLGSDTSSKVFVYFADHGAPGLICTPAGRSSEWIHADELQDTFKTMQANGMYKELTFYVEACESGSMFPDLTADQNIYAMTASNATQSSYGAYCGSQARVNGKNIGSCLADLFSINWMTDTESNDPFSETLKTQYENVKRTTNMSPVQEFGDLSIQDELVAAFETDGSQYSAKHLMKKVDHFRKAVTAKLTAEADAEEPISVDSRDMDLHFAVEQHKLQGTEETAAAVEKELAHRYSVDAVFEKVIAPEENIALVGEVSDFDCYRTLLAAYEDMCGPWTSYALKYAKYLSTACATMTPDQISERVFGTFATVC